MSIAEIYCGDKATYEVPIYQRNYAWEKDEISALIQDVYDAYTSQKQTYFIGTLVSFHKGDQIYEVIDGQQRLTTVNLVLRALNVTTRNKLTYRARKKSNETIQSMPHFEIDEKDMGIVNGFKHAQEAIKQIVPQGGQDDFKTYFQQNVHLIHYQVPRDIDLNHYFEVMNSRGEQLEKHEIIKARLIEKLNDTDKAKFNRLWECCSEMNVYIQQKYRDEKVFGKDFFDLKTESFDHLPEVNGNVGTITISNLIKQKGVDAQSDLKDRIDTFQPIIDFSNFLLIVLKYTLIKEEGFRPTDFTLDDKELIREFDKVKVIDEAFVKRFSFNLLKAKFLLDNYMVHHSNEEDTIENNPWKLQYWHKHEKNEYLKNLGEESDEQDKLVQLLSMLEVSFTARQRKNYLFYCLMHLLDSNVGNISINKYLEFVSSLADKFFKDVYLLSGNLNEVNTPLPGSFDNIILKDNALELTIGNKKCDFGAIYGNGIEASKGISLFVFNYLDYKLWEKYADELRGKNEKEGSKERNEFFETLGCSDFGLKVFDQFYFSRTRRSLEHYFPQANVKQDNSTPSEAEINCFGNYAMIGSEANSSGSNWSPIEKRNRYLDTSKKISPVSVSSIKFRVMMQKCKDNEVENERNNGQEWNFDDIKLHQEKMLNVLGLINCG